MKRLGLIYWFQPFRIFYGGSGMSKTITKCSECGSGNLRYKPDGSIFCEICRTFINQEVTMKKLKFIGVDDWDRPVYQDESGKFWKDVNLGSGTPHLHSSADNEFDGEPDMPITGEYEIITGEDS
jgi:hypothetical protein